MEISDIKDFLFDDQKELLETEYNGDHYDFLDKEEPFPAGFECVYAEDREYLGLYHHIDENSNIEIGISHIREDIEKAKEFFERFGFGESDIKVIAGEFYN